VAKWLVVTGLVFITGGHWAILQSAAWLGMFVNFSQRESVIVALEKTFDGQHPCHLCKAVQEGKKSQKKQELQKVETKLDFFCIKQLLAIEPPPPFSCPTASLNSLAGRSEAPPKPPPRAA
jgi:hypothetical protein